MDNQSVPGITDFVSALIIVAKHRLALTVPQTLNAVSYAYQAVLNEEVLSKLEREMTEMEVCILEESNARCMELLKRQLAYLDTIMHGETPHGRC